MKQLFLLCALLCASNAYALKCEHIRKSFESRGKWAIATVHCPDAKRQFMLNYGYQVNGLGEVYEILLEPYMDKPIGVTIESMPVGDTTKEHTLTVQMFCCTD